MRRTHHVRNYQNRCGNLQWNWHGRRACTRWLHPLRLDYTRLKERLGESSGRRRKTTKPAFVELIAPKPTKLHEFVIEIEASHGAKMRIEWRTAAPPNWTALLRAWRAVEG